MSGVIHELRAVMPARPLNYVEALRVAELQANRLLAAMGIHEPAVPESIITDLPRVQVEYLPSAPLSGVTGWLKGRYLIALDAGEPHVRQRFSLAHEFKHVLDRPLIGVLYPGQFGMNASARAEQVCDYFAGCVLMPRMWLKRAWTTETQDVRLLAERFEVSSTAMRVRLQQVGLVDARQRCGVPALAAGT